MANFARFIQDSETIDYTPASAVSAGQVVVLADLIGVAKLDIAANVLGALHITGIFDFPKSTAGGSAIAVGTTVYWNTDSYVAQATASTYKQLGKVIRAAVDADTTVRIVLNGLVSTSVNPLAAGIADPGASGAIPVTASGYVDLVTAAAETRTLAAPSFKGQQLLLSMKTDGGDCVVTVATTVNQTGDNTITFNDAGDAVLLVAKTNGANIRWSVVSNDGAALSTV
jgi:predicted RecA/RadA family phage recombinase